MRTFLLGVNLLIFVICIDGAESAQQRSAISENAEKNRIASVLTQARDQIWSEKKSGQYWIYPSYLGPMYISEYYLMTRWLELEHSQINDKILKRQILSLQLSDGSWEILHDANRPMGNLNATIFHYWALKAMGVSTRNSEIRRARAFILSKGGIARASLFTKTFLTLFNILPWRDFPKVPYLLFSGASPINDRDFAQWIGPHLISMAYLRKLEVVKDLGPNFALDELFLVKPKWKTEINITMPPNYFDSKIAKKILYSQKPQGSWGGYTVATLLSMAVLQHERHYSQDGQYRDALEGAMRAGFDFVERFYILSPEAPEAAYKGVACDGRYWDTALVGQGVAEAGVSHLELASVAQYLISKQNQNSGGFGFGVDFEAYEDTDDTAEILLFLKKTSQYNAAATRAVEWLVKMQNRDGGWGAFDKDNTGNRILRSFAKKFEDSADLFDESSADVTGHVLEALAAYDYNQNFSVVKNAIKYLYKTQEHSLGFGGWEGRWAVNYIYGTAAAVIGLIKVGVSPNEPHVKKALDWLEQCPSEDGGFGESFQSYSNKALKCGGVSTATQSAWAVMALIEGGRAHSPAVRRAVLYLTEQYEREGRWVDSSFIGTGHPKIVPMEYPAYPKSFPLMALARYLKEF